MELQLVSKETAILAKELGFLPTGSTNTDVITVIKDDVRQFGKHWSHYNPLREVYLPEQELLTKWLRDSFDVVVYVLPEEDEEPEQILYSCKITTYVKGRQVDDYDTGSLFSIYEEALEEGLFESLKQLKLANIKKNP